MRIIHFPKWFTGSIALLAALTVHAQSYNLAEMLQSGQLVTSDRTQTSILPGDKPGAIRTVHTTWFKDLRFTEGTIELDMRGKNQFLRSFLGIVFHGTDTLTHDVLYFRPFNFRHADTLRRHWSVQYMSLPSHPWPRLRKQHPLTYENTVDTTINPDDWFHATITIKQRMLRVFVNHAATPSLEVPLLNERSDGMFGLFSDGLASDFANLVIKPEPVKPEPLTTLLTGTEAVKGLRLLEGLEMRDGVIEMDMRGNDTTGNSFLGIAFHLQDTSHFEVLYFRPFNFKTTDSLRHLHAVQYMQLPDYPWNKLRTQWPERYEWSVTPEPDGKEWFHARIRLQGPWITVYVNGATIPSLQVRAPKSYQSGKLALWTERFAAPGYFRNVQVSRQ